MENTKKTGRPAIHDHGVRHIARNPIKKQTPLHLVIKIEKEKAGLRNKDLLKLLHRAIRNARFYGLKVVHYTLRFDTVHLLVEATDQAVTSKGMQSFGITFSKGINRIKSMSGQVYKTRHNNRPLNSVKEIKNVLNYILGSTSRSKQYSPGMFSFNSLLVVNDFSKFLPGFETKIERTINKNPHLVFLQNHLKNILHKATSRHLKLMAG